MLSSSKDWTLTTDIRLGGWLNGRLFFINFFRAFAGFGPSAADSGTACVGAVTARSAGTMLGRGLANVGTLGSVFRDLRMDGLIPRKEAGRIECCVASLIVEFDTSGKVSISIGGGVHFET
jgi:hypothetical protein